MPSPFTWDVAKPAGGDALNIGDNQIRTDKTTIRDVLRTLVPFGAPSIGWRQVQIGNVNYIAHNASWDGAAWNRDDVAEEASIIQQKDDGSWSLQNAAAAANPITFTERFSISITGVVKLFSDLQVNSDNVFDIGTSTFRPKDVYVGTSVRIGTNPATAGGLRLANSAAVVARNTANSSDLTLIGANTADQVVLSGDGNDIKWGKALVALGGGAAPTLGTIGGSGPATAAQNTWMRVIDSTGAAFWVPAWK